MRRLRPAGRPVDNSVQIRRFSVSSSSASESITSSVKRRTSASAIDVFPQVFPDIVGHFEEYLDDLGIELATRPEFDFLAGGLKRLCRAIGAVHGHGVEGVGDREDARAQRDLVALQSTGIAGPVVALLVGVNNLSRLRQKGNSGDDLIAHVAVLLHLGHFLVRELAGLVQDIVGNGHLADVVQEGAAGDDADLLLRTGPFCFAMAMVNAVTRLVWS